jgi:electron transfer flavoprotein alpha subunit
MVCSMDKDIFIIAEYDQGHITHETYELITFAQDLCRGRLSIIILLDSNSEARATEIAEKTGCDIIAVIGNQLNTYNNQSYCNAIMEILPENGSFYVCLAHTSMGYDLAPQLAIKLNAACITSVEKVHEGIFSCPAYSGRFMVDIVPHTPCVVITVLPGVFPSFTSKEHSPGSVKKIKVITPQSRSKTIGYKESIHRDSRLNDADAIISAGRGVGKKDNISLLKDLAAVIPRSALGASRAVCDLGWLEYSHQIGATGQTVSPRLYIACGISGAVQHVSGMKGSLNIVAINTDPNAAIFHVAHYCITEDLTTFIPILLDEFKTGSFLKED